MYWSEVLKHLNWHTGVKMLTPKAVFRILNPDPATVVSILRGNPEIGNDDFATRDHLVALICLGCVEVKHLSMAYDSAKLALAVLLEDIPKAQQWTAADPNYNKVISRIPGSNVEDGMADAMEILRVLAIRPFQALINALNKDNISLFNEVMDEAWEFQEQHTLFAAPSPNDASTPADVLYPAARQLRDQCKCPICEVEVDKTVLKDTLSVAEYEISGMCQRCQDATFEAEDGGPFKFAWET